MENKERFNYTYSAKEQEEIKKIREKYRTPTEQENKMEQLRRLDAGVYSKAAGVAIATGILGALVLGIGMSMVMTDMMTMLAPALVIGLGCGIGVLGILLVCLAYPVYNHTLKKERERIAPQILRLSEELMK